MREKELAEAYRDLTLAQINRLEALEEPIPEALVHNLGEVTLELYRLEEVE